MHDIYSIVTYSCIMSCSVHHQIHLLVAVVCLLSSTVCSQPLQESHSNHKVDKRQSLISCFSEVEVADDETQCIGERLGRAGSIEECCRPRSTGGMEGGGFSLGGLTDCRLCPENVTSNIQVTCFSGVGCDISGASLVVPDIPTCCLMSGERSYVLSGSQACQTCVVVQWTDSPGLDLLEMSVGHTLRVEYSKGADIGFTNGQLRVIPRYITADANDITLTDPNLNLNGRDFSAIINVRPDNTALEVGDTLQLILQPSGILAPNEIILDTLDVTIIDTDTAEILLTESDYRLSPEDDGILTVIVEVRTQISSSVFLRLIPLNFSFVRDEISAGNMFLDESIVSEVLQFEDTDRPSEAISVADFDDSPIVFQVDSIGDYRVGIPITADDIYEAEQSFVVILELLNTSLSDLVSITRSRQAAVCRIIDDDSINLSWELPAYTYFEGYAEYSSLGGLFDSPIIVKVNVSLTEYLLEIYAQPRSTDDNSPFQAEWSDRNRDIDNDFEIGTSSPGLVRRINSVDALDEIAIAIFADNLFNEGHEVAVLEFTNSENRPEFLFGANPITRIVIIDRNLTVGFTRESTLVSEGVGSFELCVAIFIPDLNPLLREPFQLANPFTLQLMSVNGTAGPLDYVQITADNNLLVPFETENSTHLQCFNVTIMEDTEFERNEMFSLALSLEGSSLQTVVVEPFVSVVEIVDNDAVTIGFELTEHTVSENDGEVTLMVAILEGQTSIPVTIGLSTVDGTATSGSDYNATMVTFTLSDLTDSVNITVAILPDSILEGDEQFSAVLSLLGPLQFTDKINIEPGTTLVNILGDSSTTENVMTRVNDTVIGDPLFTVPLHVINLGELGLGGRLSLCYEVHGDADKYFNLVSDICTSVNAHYMNVSVLNVIDRIAIRAVDEGGACREVLLNVEGMCSASVDGTVVESSYMEGGISIRRFPGNRVRVSVPNCAHLSLVMWVFCQNSTLTAYDTDDNPVTVSALMMKFLIARGFNLQERSHGLIGQFWNIPITLQLVNVLSEDGLTSDPYYAVMVAHPDFVPRTFTAFYYPRTWEVGRGQKNPCLYAGGQQADSTDTSNSVIQGNYRDYVVSGPFSTQYIYSKFQDDRC